MTLTILVSLCFCAGGCTSRPASPTAPSVGRLEKLGRHSFKISTSSREAQRHFDRGLTLAYSFGHYAAVQEFRQVLQADPNCAMAYWGIALVNGPHINFPLVPPDKAAAAWEALVQAKRLAPASSQLEQALIHALEARYANPQPEDRSALDAAYASAMREVWRANPQNADVATLFAEAAMDLHPWDFWTNGVPRPWTQEILDALEQAMHLDVNHPGANHLYIHMVEASAEPGKARAQADLLRTLVPDSSHMVHMPSHIYARVGQWDKAAHANRVAMQADALYRAIYPRPGFYAMYMAHNAHFRAYVAMMQGQKSEALNCARRMVDNVPEDFLTDYAFVADGYMVFVPEVQMRFGLWEEILKEPEPREDLFLARALWRFTRAIALTALDRPQEAAAEKEAFTKAAANVPRDRTFGNNSAFDLLAIAGLVLDGEMAARKHDFDRAIRDLREAVRLEDGLRYDEPPDWILPVRHTLGAVLLRADRAAEAERVYRDDLRSYPENGWALMGLRDSLRRQGKEAEANGVDQRFREAWAKADIAPPSTCYCQAAR